MVSKTEYASTGFRFDSLQGNAFVWKVTSTDAIAAGTGYGTYQPPYHVTLKIKSITKMTQI